MEGEIQVRKGKPWFSIGILTGVAVMAGTGVLIYARVTSNAEKVETRLDGFEKTSQAISTDLKALATATQALQVGVDKALADPWTGTDMRFFALRLKQQNPSLDVPPVERVLPDGKH